jgi:hypothetical protein
MCFAWSEVAGSPEGGARPYRSRFGPRDHESFAVAEKHYDGSDAVAAARIDRVVAALEWSGAEELVELGPNRTDHYASP